MYDSVLLFYICLTEASMIFDVLFPVLYICLTEGSMIFDSVFLFYICLTELSMIFDVLFPATRARVHLSTDKVWGRWEGEAGRGIWGNNDADNNFSPLSIVFVGTNRSSWFFFISVHSIAKTNKSQKRRKQGREKNEASSVWGLRWCWAAKCPCPTQMLATHPPRIHTHVLYLLCRTWRSHNNIMIDKFHK